jgi:hypothetical protein
MMILGMLMYEGNCLNTRVRSLTRLFSLKHQRVGTSTSVGTCSRSQEGPTRVYSDVDRVTRKMAIALLIWPLTGTVRGYL